MGLIPTLREELPVPLFAPRINSVHREGERIFLAYLNRHDELIVPMEWHPRELEFGTRLEKLNLHYMEYLEALDDIEFIKVVNDWIDNNPPYRPGYWLDNWNSYALSIRVVVWLQQLQSRRSRLDSSFVQCMTGSIIAQIRFLMQNIELDICGNHIIKNIKALLWAARSFDGTEVQCWADRGAQLLERELSEQVPSDGLHFERSGAYHAQVFADLLECFSVLLPGLLRQHLADGLTRMAQVLVDLTHPDGMICLFNDSGLHMTYKSDECLAVYEQLFVPRPKPRPVFALREGGYFGFRSEESYLLADCGRIAPDTLPAHGHGDILAFEWDVRGRRILVDAGVYEYHPGIWRDLSRSTRLHNTVTLDDADQCEFWKAFRVGRRANVKINNLTFNHDRMVLDGEHDGYSRLTGHPVHRRRFEVTPRQVRVEDDVRGGSGQHVRARLMLHPDCSVVECEGGVLIHRDELEIYISSCVRIDTEKSTWMPDFGVGIPTLQLILNYGNAPCSGWFTLSITG
jgi:uncharacterized heparinase superfamily protein